MLCNLDPDQLQGQGLLKQLLSNLQDFVIHPLYIHVCIGFTRQSFMLLKLLYVIFEALNTRNFTKLNVGELYQPVYNLSCPLKLSY